MTKFKKLMALAAVSMLGIQLMGAGTAFAAGSSSDCDFGSDNLEITIDTDNVDLWIDDAGLLQCDPGGGDDDEQAVSTIDSITVEMDADDSDGVLTIYLSDLATGGGAEAAVSEWPDFDTFDINVSTTLYIDGTDANLPTSARAAERVVVGSKSLSFSGTTATFVAPKLDIATDDASDTIDASKAVVPIIADAGDGRNTVKGGSKSDDLTGGDGVDVIYGNGGNDDIDCGNDTGDAGWGGEGLDYIKDCKTAGPGAGDDEVDGATAVTYADLTGGIEYIDGETDGAAGYDDFTGSTGLAKLFGSAGDDVIVDSLGAIKTVYGLGGDDAIKVSYGDEATVYGGTGNDLIAALDAVWDDSGDGEYVAYTGAETFYGNSGNDILKGKSGNDVLRGGPGQDQAWGGNGSEDLCNAEVMNRCELIKK